MDSLPKILVIDPDARACRALRDTLEGAGFATTGAHSEARGRTLLDEPPRPLALVVGASDPFWRDGMVNDFRSFDRDLVIVAVLLPGDEYEALLELGASACASAIGIDALLPPLLLRLLHGKRTRSAPSVAPPPIAPGSAGRVPSVPTFGRPPAREALANRLDELFREASASGRPEAGPVEVRFPTWEDYGKVAAQLKRGSLFVETTTPGQVADEVRLLFVVPDGRRLELTAEVKHVVSIERATSPSSCPPTRSTSTR